MAFVFLDLDGTLLTNGTYSDDAKTVLSNLKKNGHEFCITTGRTMESLKQLKIFNKFSGYFIAENGCIVGKFEEGDLEFFGEWMKSMSSYKPSMQRLAKYFTSNGTKIYLKEYMLTIDYVEKLKIPAEFSDLISVRNLQWLDFLPKIAGKEKAAQFLISKFDLSMDSLFFVGDSFNDKALLDFVHNSGVVANASSEVKNFVLNKKGKVSEFKETQGVKNLLTVWNLI